MRGMRRGRGGRIPEFPSFFPEWEIEREFEEMVRMVEDIMERDFFTPFSGMSLMDYEVGPREPENRFPHRFWRRGIREPEHWTERAERETPPRKTPDEPSFTDSNPPGYITPIVDVIEEPEGLTVTAEMPGLSGIEDISVKVQDGGLQLRGEGEKKRYFAVVPLNTDVSGKEVKKHYRNGILELRFREENGILESGAKVLRKVEKTVEKTLKERRPSSRGKSARKTAKKTERKKKGTGRSTESNTGSGRGNSTESSNGSSTGSSGGKKVRRIKVK